MSKAKQFDAFTKSYIDALLWAELDNDGMPLDHNYKIDDVATATLDKIVEDCCRFQAENAADIESGFGIPDCTKEEIAGFNFLLTRNHHGCGFWDGSYPEPMGKRLTEAAHAYGEVNLHVGDDGKIYG